MRFCDNQSPDSIYWEGIACSLFSFFSGLPKAPPAWAACRSVSLTIETIKTKLESAKWPNFAKVKGAK
jgi:hypothetical protein